MPPLCPPVQVIPNIFPSSFFIVYSHFESYCQDTTFAFIDESRMSSSAASTLSGKLFFSVAYNQKEKITKWCSWFFVARNGRSGLRLCCETKIPARMWRYADTEHGRSTSFREAFRADFLSPRSWQCLSRSVVTAVFIHAITG